MPDEPTDDDLLRRARELKERVAEDRQSSRQKHVSASERVLRDSTWVRSLSEFFASMKKWLGPIGTFIAFVVRTFARWFRWAAFRPVDLDQDGTTDELDFSLQRFALNLMLSVLVLIAVHVALSAVYFYSTYFEETVYVTGKQEIETGELYQFGGCTSLPCSTETDNGKFYLIETSLYFPRMYYPEENVFANIPQQDAACNVEGYGLYFRTLRWLYKSLQLYQHVVDVSCRPYTADEIRKAVSEGDIVRDN